MAILTPLSLPEARRLGSLYGLAVEEVRGILAGSVNSNYGLTLEGGARAFLRVYEEQGAEAASREARLLDHLCENGVPTPRPLRRRDPAADSGGFIAEHAGKPVAVFPWVDGEILCQRRVTPEASRRVGEALARVHLAGEGFPGAPASRFDLDALGARLASLRGRELTPELAADVERLGGRLDELRAESARLPPCDEVLIHGDLFRDNVLWAGPGLAALLDFESASRGLASFDLAVTMLAWCFGDDLDPTLVAALGAGYASARPLTPPERARLHLDARQAALRFSITRITDFELRPPGSGIYKDYRRFLARHRAVERLGPDGLLRLLGA